MKLSKDEISKLPKDLKRYYKEHGRLPNQNIPTAPIEPKKESSTGLITVLCVRFGNKYGPEYVVKLRNMVSRYITVPHEFVCLTDDPNPIEGVRIIYQPQAGYSKLWWHKVHMFDPSLPISGRIFYVDLDVIICGNLDKLLAGLGNNFMGVQDFNRKFHPGWRYLNSSVMSWMHGSQYEIWQKFKNQSKDAMRLHGDQDWIWQCAKDRIKFWPQEWILSYKWEVRNREELVIKNSKRQFKFVNHEVKPIPDCSIVVFHGDPKPEEIEDKFVVDSWQ